MVPKMTPPCEVITELWFSKQPFQHHTAQHKTFQWNHRLFSTAGDSIWFRIIYWLQNSIFSEQHFSHRRGLKTHFVNFKKYCRSCTNIHWPVLCQCYIWTCPWKQDTTQQKFSESQKILTEHIVVSPFSTFRCQIHRRVIKQYRLPCQ